MTCRHMTKSESAVLTAADQLGVIPARTGPARSQFINLLRRDIDAARAQVLSASASSSPASAPASVPTSKQPPVSAASVKSTDKPRTPATVLRERAKPSSGAKLRVTSERIKPYSQPRAQPQATSTSASAPASASVGR